MCIRTIRYANINLIKCWVEEILSWTLCKTILYCGLHDISERFTTENTIEYLGGLVTTVREKNKNMEF